MISAMIWFVIGLLIGWNALEQPEWVKSLWGKADEVVDVQVEKYKNKDK